jgi:8-amino-7-oxononanoate synthase
MPLSARECWVDGATCLNFSSNDYLGLSGDPRLKAAAAAWTERLGTGTGASRLVTGTSPEVLALEARIAAWKGTEAALLVGSGYLANLGAIAALADGRGDAIVADRLNHASLNAGCRLAGGRFHRYRHGDLGHADTLLAGSAAARRCLLVSDTVFSMDGDLADVMGLASLARRHGALLYLDEAHATGLFGDRGEGLSGGDADLAMGTFSKAMGSYGAYLAGSREMIDFLVNRCAPFIFSTALPPGVCGAIEAALGLVQTEEFRDRRVRLLENAGRVVGELRNLGLDVGPSASPIIPVRVGDAAAAVECAQFLLSRGILGVAIRPPTVPAGTARIRLSLNAAHTPGDLERLIAACREMRVRDRCVGSREGTRRA